MDTALRSEGYSFDIASSLVGKLFPKVEEIDDEEADLELTEFRNHLDRVWANRRRKGLMK